MTLGTAILVLVFALIGIVLAHKYLCKKRAAHVFCIVRLVLLALTCTVYISNGEIDRCLSSSAPMRA